VTTFQAARPRVQRMLDDGYCLKKIDEKIEAIEGLNPEEKSALWVWAWAFEDMARQQAHGPHHARRRPGPPGG
jgi:hypothetical protein